MGVARAVIASPKLLLADEPTGNLHSAQGEEIMELFTRLNRQGTTIVQVTHSEKNAVYGHRTIQLRDGWIVGEPGRRAAVSAGRALSVVGTVAVPFHHGSTEVTETAAENSKVSCCRVFRSASVPSVLPWSHSVPPW